MRGMRFRQMSVLVCAALGLSACGGGSNSNVKPAGPYALPSPGYTPPGAGYTPSTGLGDSGTLTSPTTPTPPPTDQPLDVQLSLTHADAAHTAGFTVAGVTIGVVDSIIMSNHPVLVGRVSKSWSTSTLRPTTSPSMT